jgi:hypothetical protein
MLAPSLPHLRFTSPLEGEVAERSEAGGGYFKRKAPPSPPLPRKGGGSTQCVQKIQRHS